MDGRLICEVPRPAHDIVNCGAAGKMVLPGLDEPNDYYPYHGHPSHVGVTTGVDDFESVVDSVFASDVSVVDTVVDVDSDWPFAWCMPDAHVLYVRVLGMLLPVDGNN